jgi:hypothetical protein
MPLKFPKALSLNDFNGGYITKGTTQNIGDNQSSDAENVEILDSGAIAKRKGYRRLLNTALTTFNNTGTLKIDSSAAGDSILGHFQIIKVFDPSDIKKTVVAAGPNLWQYTSATASVIAQNLDSSNQWHFTHIQDPRSASDDVLIGVNGIDEPKMWNGTESSAVNLSDQTSATGVLPSKFIASLKNRVYLLNVKDDSDVDSKVKVLISGFSDEGTPRPQRFVDFFFVGGSDKEGEITGSTVLNDQLIIFKRNATFKFSPGAGRIIDTAQLVQVDEQIGCVAPRSIAVAGNVCFFLGELGVFAFDGNKFQYISNDIEPDFKDVNKKFITKSTGMYYREKNQYWISVPGQGSEYLNKTYIYDITKGIWYPPYNGYDVTVLSTQRDLRDVQRVIAGDRHGFLHYHDTGFADNVTATFERYLTSVPSDSGTLLTDACSTFPTDGDGIGPAKLRIVSGAGLGKEFTVIGCTAATTLRLSSDDDATGLDTSSKFIIGGIKSHYRTKDYDFDEPDLDKLYRRVSVRTTQEGSHNLSVNYIVDFKSLNKVPTSTVSLIKDAPVFGTATFASARFGGTEVLTKKVVIKSISTQSVTGKNFSLRFVNDRPFEPWEIQGFDMELKRVGRR